MSTRSLYIAGFCTIVLLLLISLWVQYYDGFIPCPLCTLQRFSFGLLGIWFFIGIWIHRNRVARIIISLLSIFTATLGIFFAGRQVWLQWFTTENSAECGVSIQYMLHVLSFKDAAQKIFAGSAECVQDGWNFLFLNMAEWSLVWFILLFILSGYLLKKGYHE